MARSVNGLYLGQAARIAKQDLLEEIDGTIDLVAPPKLKHHAFCKSCKKHYPDDGYELCPACRKTVHCDHQYASRGTRYFDGFEVVDTFQDECRICGHIDIVAYTEAEIPL